MILPDPDLSRSMSPLTLLLLGVALAVGLVTAAWLLWGPQGAGPVGLVIAGAAEGERRRRKAARDIRVEKRTVRERDAAEVARSVERQAQADEAAERATRADVDELARRANER